MGVRSEELWVQSGGAGPVLGELGLWFRSWSATMGFGRGDGVGLQVGMGSGEEMVGRAWVRSGGLGLGF